MFIALSTCASNGDAFFFGRDRREEPLPVGCSLLDIREVAEETGISVDDVLSGLDDFASADALLGFGVSLATAEAAEEVVCTEAPVREPVFERKEPLLADAAAPMAEETAIFEPPVELELEFEEEPAPQAETVFEAVMETVVVEETSEPAPMVEALPLEPRIEDKPVAAAEEKYGAPREAAIIETEIEARLAAENTEASALPKEPMMLETLAAEKVSAAWERRRLRLRKRAAFRGMEKKQEPVEEQKVVAAGAPEFPLKKRPRLDLAKLRKMANVRVEAAEPEDEGADDHLIDLNVPDGYVVQTSTESVVWPWEVQPDMTLKEALEAISDSLLASLTEEVVNCTITGQMGEGGIKSLCEYYQKDMEQIYGAIQKESRRRITRMSAQAPRPASMGAVAEATQEMAMRMAKQFLQNEMGKKAMRFKSPFPDENGIYHIFQSHRVEDEDEVDFPNERVFYREVGNGWAISVGY